MNADDQIQRLNQHQRAIARHLTEIKHAAKES